MTPRRMILLGLLVAAVWVLLVVFVIARTTSR